MKYNDGKYHVEFMEHSYFGGYRESSWTIVNVHGESVRKDGITLRFDTKENAEKFINKLNVCSDGGILTNLT